LYPSWCSRARSASAVSPATATAMESDDMAIDRSPPIPLLCVRVAAGCYFLFLIYAGSYCLLASTSTKYSLRFKI
jgi:hypothetical protein